MRIKGRLRIRQGVGGTVDIIAGIEGTDMTRVVALNESALLLYNALKGREFEVEDVVRVMVDEYEVDEESARRDAEVWLADMKKNKLVL